MAYKFQLGSAVLSGSATYLDKIDSVAGTLSAVNISGSGKSLTVRGTNAVVRAGDEIQFNLNDEVKHIYNGGESQFLLELDGDNPKLSFYKSGSTSGKVIEMAQTGVGGSAYYLHILSGSGDTMTAGWKFNDSNPAGDVSGSGNLTVTQNATMRGTTTFTTGLTVNGSTTSLQATNVEIKDVLIQVDAEATNDAQSQGSGYLFGVGSSTSGGQILYISSSAQQRHIAFRNSAGGGVPVRASEFVGDGGGLTNASADVLAYGINEVTMSANPATAVKNKTNVITNSPSGEQRLTLPQMSAMSNGDVIRIKLEGTANATNRVKIETNPSDPKVGIDGQPELLLMSPSASVELVYLGTIDSSGSFAIF
jgi:hypothetical protein